MCAYKCTRPFLHNFTIYGLIIFSAKGKVVKYHFSHFVSSTYVVDKFIQLPICIKKTMPHHTYQYGVDTAFFIIDLKSRAAALCLHFSPSLWFTKLRQTRSHALTRSMFGFRRTTSRCRRKGKSNGHARFTSHNRLFSLLRTTPFLLL